MGNAVTGRDGEMSFNNVLDERREGGEDRCI